MSSSAQHIGIKKNRLLRYKKVLDRYLEVKKEGVTTMHVWREYIYPEFAISRCTLYTILNTPVDRDLKNIKEEEDKQLNLF